MEIHKLMHRQQHNRMGLFFPTAIVLFFLNLIYIEVSQINRPHDKQKNKSLWLISLELQLIYSPYNVHPLLTLSTLEVEPYPCNTETHRYSLTTVVLNLLLSYSAPQISTSTKGQAMLLPSLGRWRAPKTCKSNCKLEPPPKETWHHFC